MNSSNITYCYQFTYCFAKLYKKTYVLSSHLASIIKLENVRVPIDIYAATHSQIILLKVLLNEFLFTHLLNREALHVLT